MTDPMEAFHAKIGGDAHAQAMLDAMVQSERERLTRQRIGQTEVKEVPYVTTGFWTPTLVGDGTAGTFTYDTSLTGGEYTRIGNRVYVNGRVRITVITVNPTGNLNIGGLPITSGTTSSPAFDQLGNLNLSEWTGITLTAGYTQLALRILGGVTKATFVQSGSNIGAAAIAGGALVLVGGVANFRVEGVYRVA